MAKFAEFLFYALRLATQLLRGRPPQKGDRKHIQRELNDRGSHSNQCSREPCLPVLGFSDMPDSPAHVLNQPQRKEARRKHHKPLERAHLNSK